MLQLKILNGKCAKIHTTCGSKQRKITWQQHSIIACCAPHIYIYMGVVLRTHPVCGESHKSHISLADIWVLLIYQYRPKQHWLSVGVDKTLSYSSRMQTPCTIKYSKPRLIHIQFDWRFYPVWAKIRIKRRWLFLTWCHLSTDISVKIYGAPVVKILYLTDLAQKLLSLRIFRYLCAEIAISARI